ncbi:MAG: hypothetical protein ACOYBS_09425 [Flavobacterium sp.]
MKKIQLFVLLIFSYQMIAQTGIGTTTPDTSAKLEIASIAKGLLLPRMNAAQRGLISTPANGLLVYQTDAPTGFYVNTGTSASPVWTRVNMDWTRSGNDISYTSGNVSTTGNLTGGNVASSKLSGFVANVSSEASSRTIALGDNGMTLKCTAGVTLTLPAVGTLPEGFNCMVMQHSFNQVSFSGTFSNRNSFTKTAGQYAIATVFYIGGVYIISGEMSN